MKAARVIAALPRTSPNRVGVREVLFTPSLCEHTKARVNTSPSRCVTNFICAEFPEARILPCGAGTSLLEMRTLAFESSRGEFIVIT